MRMGKKYLSIFLSFLVLLFVHLPLQAQKMGASFNSKTIQLQIKPMLNNQPLGLGQKVFVPLLNDSVQIDRLRFYLSGMSFSNASDNQEKIEQQFFLIDLEDPTSLRRQLPLKTVGQWDSIHFKIGVDSTTQLKGAQGEDLDPMHGMYWSWRSGYINFKCEGISPICPGRNNAFVFHIGGFQAPFNTIQSVSLPVYSDTVVIQIDLAPIFTLSNITQNYEVMSPNAEAMTFSNQFPSLFRSIQ
tara:strand:+ start:59 stop:787 length:729 start_codon:yes stop_codon:yes gene_type:complete